MCDHLGVSSLAFRLRRFVSIAVSFHCRHTVVAVDPSLIGYEPGLTLSSDMIDDTFDVAVALIRNEFDDPFDVTFHDPEQETTAHGYTKPLVGSGSQCLRRPARR